MSSATLPHLGKALLDRVVLVGLESGEGGREDVAAGVGGLDERVGLLHLEEVPRAEVANHLGVLPPVELAVEGDGVGELLGVAPLGEGPVDRDLTTQDVGQSFAVVVDEAGLEVAVEGKLAFDGLVAGRRPRHDSPRRVEACVGAELEDRVHRHMKAGVQKSPEGSAVPTAECNVGDGGDLSQILVKVDDGNGLCLTEAHVGGTQPDVVMGGIDDRVGLDGRLPLAGLAVADRRVVNGDHVLVALRGTALDVEGKAARPQVLGRERPLFAEKDRRVREKPLVAPGHRHIPLGGGGRGLLVIPDDIRCHKKRSIS